MIVVNGWIIYAHPLLLDQLEKLTAVVEKAKAKNPQDWARTANAKVLAAVRSLMLETVPSDPTRPEYRQGGTLGAAWKHWFRAKFGNGRFRLFFRYDSRAKVIIFAWVNDDTTLRTYGSIDRQLIGDRSCRANMNATDSHAPASSPPSWPPAAFHR